jgi:divalent metal cation (Fe/Co/Zn/Cd) transporter
VNQVKSIVERTSQKINCSNVSVRKEKSGVSVLIQCSTDGTISLGDSHEISDVIEKNIMESIPEVTHVFIHIEPL